MAVDRTNDTQLTAGVASFGTRVLVTIGISTALAVFAPLAGAFADDGDRQPGAPVMRGADRGAAMSGTGEIRTGSQVRDANNNYVAILGGNTPAGAPILVKDGNARDMPVIGGEAGVICSKGQNKRSAMIPCGG